MATSLQNLSGHDPSSIPSGQGKRVAIVVAEWNKEITFALRDAAIASLKQHGVEEQSIAVHYVPGTFELSFGSMLAGSHADIDGVIAIGCVIQGETPHFDYICQAVSYGITELNLRLGKPVIFGVLTTNTIEQAKERSGGKHGNKGDEAAVTVLKMLAMKNSFLK
jgi:6,7-dimethyl-8-ribityllumazine synthase